jgi:hypothetical protein
LQYTQQGLRVAVIQVYLIRAEGRPNMNGLPVGFLEWREQRRGTRTGHAAKVRVRQFSAKQPAKGGIACQERLKPPALRRHMVDDSVNH